MKTKGIRSKPTLGKYRPTKAERARLNQYEPPASEGDSELVDAVIEEMSKQIKFGDWTAIDEMLRFLPRQHLIWFLAEERQPDFE